MGGFARESCAVAHVVGLDGAAGGTCRNIVVSYRCSNEKSNGKDMASTMETKEYIAVCSKSNENVAGSWKRCLGFQGLLAQTF